MPLFKKTIKHTHTQCNPVNGNTSEFLPHVKVEESTQENKIICKSLIQPVPKSILTGFVLKSSRQLHYLAEFLEMVGH